MNTSKLESQITRKTTLLGNQLTNITVFRKDRKKLIDPKDVKQMVAELHKKSLKEVGSNDFKIYTRTWAGDMAHTFNVDEQGDVLKFDESDDYYQGKVKNTKKFLKYYKVDFYVEKF